MATLDESAEEEDEKCEPWWKCPKKRATKEGKDESKESDPWWKRCCPKKRSEEDSEDESGKSEPEPWWKYCCPKKRSEEEGEDESGEVEPGPWWQRCCPKKRPQAEGEDESGSEPWWRYCCPRTPEESVSRQIQETHAYDEQISTDSTFEEKNIPARHLPLTFIPNYIIREIFAHSFKDVPHVKTSTLVLLMVDVCGFTSLCEDYCAKGVTGIEELIHDLNGFMSALAAMLLERGGDILNFAGDAFFVQWIQKGKTSIEKTVADAYKCAVALQTHQFLKTKNMGGKLKVKIGIAMGEASTWTLGSEDFLLFATAGPGVPRVQKAEGLCSPGDIVVDKNVHNVLTEMKVGNFTSVLLENGYVKITEYPPEKSCKAPQPNRLQLFRTCKEENICVAETFLLPPIRGLKSFDDLQYLSEMTMVTVLFINLSVNVVEPTLLDKSFDIILGSCKTHEAVLNKLSMFDKGCTFLVVLGLPGLKHANDAALGVCCAHDIVAKLGEIDINASIGITTGTCFCGLVGHPQRQEYTVIGNRVNMAARLMVVYRDERIALNRDTYHLSRDELGHRNFIELPARKMKGIDSAGTVYGYRKQLAATKVSSVTRFSVVEESNLYGADAEKDKIRQCIKAMGNDKERRDMKEKSLLPALIIKGLTSSGRSYLMYFAVDAALALNYKFVACCSVGSSSREPFYVIARLIERMLKMDTNGNSFSRENLITSVLPTSTYPELFVLNHFFDCEFPVPEDVDGYLVNRNDKIAKLFKLIIRNLCGDTPTLFAIDNADYMDEKSWDVLHQLLEEEKILVALSLSLHFKEKNRAQSVLLMKAYLHHNIETLQEHLFASLICWNLHVQAVHIKLFRYLEEATGGQATNLREICLSPAINQVTKIVPFESIPEAKLQKEFFVDRFCVLSYDKPMACDLKPEINLKNAWIPANVQDSVKETLNNLTLQERLLLKRATVLGQDFDLHSLECISTGISRGDVLQMVQNLLSNNVFTTVCSLLNAIEPSGNVSSYTVALEYRNICFCFSVYLNSQTSDKVTPFWPIGPYHRLKFRTPEFRNDMLSQMTQEQIYTLRMEVASNLESKGPECSSCKSKRLSDYKKKTERRYSVILSECTCLQIRPKLYAEISVLYSRLGMLFWPVYYEKKAAQAANDVNHPIRALYYIQHAEDKMPQYRLMSEADKNEEEKHFDPVILDVSLKKATAVALLILGDTYRAASIVYEAADLLGIQAVCFHGVFNWREFKNLLSKLILLHAETITKLIGVLAKAYMEAHVYELARSLLQMEYRALQSYPTDFVHILRHMTMMYKLNYLINKKQNMKNLEKNMLKLCHSRYSNLDISMDLTEIRTAGNMYTTLLEVNVALSNSDRVEVVVDESSRVFNSVNFRGKLPLIRVFAFHFYYYYKEFGKCSTTVIELGRMVDTSENRTPRALYNCCLAMFLMKSAEGIHKTEIQLNYDKCNTFATRWIDESSRLITKDLQFYISVVMANWCLHSDENTTWIRGNYAFTECYKLATSLNHSIDKSKHTFWTISAILKLLQLQFQLQFTKKVHGFKDFTMDKDALKQELEYLKPKINDNYLLFIEDYKTFVSDVKLKKLID